MLRNEQGSALALACRAGLLAAFATVLMAAPAQAEWHGYRHGRPWHRDWHGYAGGYYPPPPVIVAPPPVRYYAPPPVVFSPGIYVHIR